MKPNAAGLIARIGFTLVAVAIFIGTVSAAQPINITVQNYSFETPVTTNFINVGPGSGLTTPPASLLSGWNIYGANSYVVKNGGLVTYSSGVVGNQALFLEPYADGSDTDPVLNPHLWQIVGSKFARGTYTLSVNAGMGSGYATLAEDATAEFQLLAYEGGEVYNYNLGVAPTSVLVKNYNGSLNTFNYTLNLTGTESFIGDDVTIFLKAYKNGSTDQNVSYDNVQLTYTPPVNHVYNGDFQISPQNGYGPIAGWTQVPNPSGVPGFAYVSGGQIGVGDVGVGAWDNGYVPGTDLSTNAVAFIETFTPAETLSLTQTVTGLTPGQMYELSYYENGRADTRVNTTTAETFVGGVSLVAAHTVPPVNAKGVTTNPFYYKTAQFTATAESMVLEFRATQLNGNDSFLVIDNVSISAVPEPSTLILSTAGLIGLLADAWRKR
jgi:hypothetical protein